MCALYLLCLYVFNYINKTHETRETPYYCRFLFRRLMYFVTIVETQYTPHGQLDAMLMIN